MIRYQVGDKVRVILREGGVSEYPFGFSDEMNDRFANGIVTITFCIEKEASLYRSRKRYNGDEAGYRIKEDGGTFTWHSSMFEPVLEKPTNLAEEGVVREGTVVNLGPYKGVISNSCSGFFLLMMTAAQTHHEICKEIEKIVPDYREISKKYSVSFCEAKDCDFPIFSTIANLYMYCLVLNDKITKALCLGDQTITPKKLNEDEIRFQKSKGHYVRGSVPEGRTVCGRRHKTAIAVRHLGHEKISC